MLFEINGLRMRSMSELQHILVDIFGIEFLKIGWAIITFCWGIATLIGPPLVGWLKVYFGTYDIPFAVVAGVFYGGGILAFIVLCIHKRIEGSA